MHFFGWVHGVTAVQYADFHGNAAKHSSGKPPCAAVYGVAGAALYVAFLET